MSRSLLTALAMVMLMVTLWLNHETEQPGLNLWAAIGTGAAAAATVHLIVAAARARR